MIIAEDCPPPGENVIKGNAFFGDTTEEMGQLART